MKVKLAMASVFIFALALFSSAGEDNAKKLVGKWEVTKDLLNPFPGKAFMEFTVDSKYATTTTSDDGTMVVVKGTYAVKDNVITITLDKKVLNKEVKLTRKIKKLTETELHVQLADGKESTVSELKRVKP